jgi:predicted Rossmann fold flavoprotein
VPTEEAPLEKVFPSSGRARDVRDALERAAVTAGARLELSAPVRGVERAGAGWRVLLDAGALEAERVIVACGGKSYPSTGTTGDGYAWLARLGLPVVEPRPALVPLRSPEPWVRELAGVALQDVEARLVDAPSGALARRRRPIVFTHAGLSGPAAMDLSGAVARRLPQPSTLAIDLLPATSREELRGKLVRLAAERGAAELAGCLGPAAPRRLAEAALRQAKLSPSARASALTRAGRHAFVEALKGLAVAIDGTLGWEKAELTGGGLALEALDPGTMQVKGLPGLFACGEILDLQGPIGGLSFQAAFATAELAGRAAARA